jgi:hypothetical protein
VAFASAPTHEVASLLLLYPVRGMNIGPSGDATAVGRVLPGSTNAQTDNLPSITLRGGLGHQQ